MLVQKKIEQQEKKNAQAKQVSIEASDGSQRTKSVIQIALSKSNKASSSTNVGQAATKAQEKTIVIS